jgi:hypothetical protein
MDQRAPNSTVSIPKGADSFELRVRDCALENDREIITVNETKKIFHGSIDKFDLRCYVCGTPRTS